jgi:hypothetical protein
MWLWDAIMAEYDNLRTWPVMPREKAQAEKPRAPRKLGVPVQCGAGLHQKFATADIRDAYAARRV